MCESLIETDEYHSDKYLAHLVQIQYLLEKIDRLLNQHKSSPVDAIQLHFAALRSELNLCKERLPFRLSESGKDRFARVYVQLSAHAGSTQICSLSNSIQPSSFYVK